MNEQDARNRQLLAAFGRGESICVVHYACGNFYQAKDHPVPVTCISVVDPYDLTTRAFAHSNLNISDPVEREAELLQQFYSYLQRNAEARLVHWNMNNADYGFDALTHRLTWLTTSQPAFQPSRDRLHDLDGMITAELGEDYASHPKLLTLATLNGIGQRHWLPGPEEVEKADRGDWAAIQRSTSEKARAIARLLGLYCRGQLVTQDSAGTIAFGGARLEAVRVVLEVAERQLLVERSLARRHDGRPTITVSDEYDHQDLLRSLLVLFFEDVRDEPWTPNYAGGSARIDFLLKDVNLALEVKRSRQSMTSRSLGDELIIDRDRYAQETSVRHLVCVVFDRDGLLRNPRGLEKDLSRDASDQRIAVTVRIFDR